MHASTTICKGRYLSYKDSCCVGPTANRTNLIIFITVTISFNNESRSGGVLLTKQLLLIEERRLAFKHIIFYTVTTPFLVEIITDKLIIHRVILCPNRCTANMPRTELSHYTLVVLSNHKIK